LFSTEVIQSKNKHNHFYTLLSVGKRFSNLAQFDVGHSF